MLADVGFQEIEIVEVCVLMEAEQSAVVFHETYGGETVGRVFQHDYAESDIVIHHRVGGVPQEEVFEFF